MEVALRFQLSQAEHPVVVFILITLNYKHVIHKEVTAETDLTLLFSLSLLSVMIETDSYTADCIIIISLE